MLFISFQIYKLFHISLKKKKKKASNSPVLQLARKQCKKTTAFMVQPLQKCSLSNHDHPQQAKS